MRGRCRTGRSGGINAVAKSHAAGAGSDGAYHRLEPGRMLTSSGSSVRYAASVWTTSSYLVDSPSHSKARRVPHPALVLDECTHPARGPQPADVAERLGPRMSACSIFRSWRALSLGLRPARPAWFNPPDRTAQAAAPSESPIADGRPSAALPHWLTPCLSRPFAE